MRTSKCLSLSTLRIVTQALMRHETALMCRFADLDPFARSKYFGWNLDLVSPHLVFLPP